MDHLLPGGLQVPLLHEGKGFLRMERSDGELRKAKFEKIPALLKSNANHFHDEAGGSLVPPAGMDSLCRKRHSCSHDQHLEVWPCGHHLVLVGEEQERDHAKVFSVMEWPFMRSSQTVQHCFA